MDFASHRGSRLFHRARHDVGGEPVTLLVHSQHHDGRPSLALAESRALTAFADMRRGVDRHLAGVQVRPHAFAPHEIMSCGVDNEWVASAVVGGEGIFVRVAAASEAEARAKLGTLVRHLQDGDWHAHATRRVAEHARRTAGTKGAPR